MDIGSFLNAIVTLCLIISAKALRIKQCETGKMTVKGNEINTIVCDEFGTNDTVTWTIEFNGVAETLTTCGPKQCRISPIADYNVYRDSNSVSLYIFGHSSLHNGVLTCIAQKPAVTVPTTLKCTIRVKDTSTFGPGTSQKPEVTGSGQQQPFDKSKESSKDELPVGAIAGGAVAALAVVIVAVVIVVIITRRRRREKHEAATNAQQSNEVGTRNNPAYGTVDNSDDHNLPYDAGSPEVGIYAFPGGDEAATIPDNTPAAEEDDIGMYAAPKADVYAAVDKSKQKKIKPATSDHSDASQAAIATDEYAVVNKASKKTEASNSTGLSEVHIPEDNSATAAPAPYIYAQVDKTAKQAKTPVSVQKTPEEEGATYAQVQKPKKK